MQARTLTSIVYGIPFLIGGCGFSGQINENLSGTEQSLQSEATRQALQQTSLIVQKAHEILPNSDAPIFVDVPSSQCRLQLVHSADDVALALSTPACTIEVPRLKEVQVGISLRDLGLSAHRAADGVVNLSGKGELTLSANLPIIGDYGGSLHFELHDSSVDTHQQTVNLSVGLTYQSGMSTSQLNIHVEGARDAVHGTVTGASLRCDVSGSLESPNLRCTRPDGSPLD